MSEEVFVISADGAGYGFLVDGKGRLRQAGFAPAIASHMDRLRADVPAELYPLAYPAYDEDPLHAPAIRITHSDGRTATRLVVDTMAPEGSNPHITLVDPVCPIEVRLCFAAEDHGVVRQWTEVTNNEDGPITLHEVANASPLVAFARPTLTHYAGSDWSAEWSATTERLTPGTKVIESRGGVRPHLLCAPFFLLSDGRPEEEEGTVVAGAVAWAGNVRVAFESYGGAVRVASGHNPAGADYVLDPGQCFRTPEQIWAWSTRGTGELSRRMHRWIRSSVVRDGATERPIVANNWEATFFSFDTARLVGLIDHAADVGAELFLLDDGWFGSRHPRNDDTAGLGDWEVNDEKLPGGLAPVAAHAAARGLRFGLWVEPEMLNPDSTAYEAHPEWIVSQSGRHPRRVRNQYALDILRPDVARFVLGVFDQVLRETPGITYLKWDANRHLTEPGSPTLAGDRQSNFWVDHARATWQLMDEVQRRHPSQMLMLCASGGGRFDLGTLRFFHEVWLSDNTDPLDRVRMQWHASHFVPAAVVAAHVTTLGDRPVAFACAVAMSARFGFDIDFAALGSDEADVCRRATQLYKRIRPLVQHGDLYRLVPPDARSALSFVAPDRTSAVVFGYQLSDDPPEGAHALALKGLDPAAGYRVTPIDLTVGELEARTVSGASLASDGLDWPLTAACTARIWVLDAENPAAGVTWRARAAP